MEIGRLRAFIAVADLAHFGRAAEYLHLTQPGLTKRIRSLEDVLGGALLDRDRHPVSLTALGQQLLPAARRLVADADMFILEAKRSVAGETGSLAIGFGLSTITLAPRIINRFRSLAPRVAVTMNDFSSREMIGRIRRDELDLGFVRFPVPADLDSLPLATDQLAVAVPAGLEMAKDDLLLHLSEREFIALRDDRGPGLANQIRHWCHAHAFHPRVVQQADDIQTVLALVAAGLGCAIVPASSTMLLAGRLKLFLLPGAKAIWRVGAAWRPGRNVGALARAIRVVQDWSESDSERNEIPPVDEPEALIPTFPGKVGAPGLRPHSRGFRRET